MFTASASFIRPAFPQPTLAVSTAFPASTFGGSSTDVPGSTFKHASPSANRTIPDHHRLPEGFIWLAPTPPCPIPLRSRGSELNRKSNPKRLENLVQFRHYRCDVQASAWGGQKRGRNAA